jgi:cobalt/nickel transport system permease protein
VADALNPLAGHGPLLRLDPRLRLLTAAAFAVIVVAGRTPSMLITALALAVLLAAAARLPWGPTRRRLLAMDGFIIAMLILLPFTQPGEPVWQWGSLTASREGLQQAVTIALKANAVVLMLLTLVGTLPVTTLGHALHHLRVPAKLVHLLLFTVRYLEVLRQEYRRLRQAMRARAFVPRSDRHTWRSFGYLFGMLLVRSLERSERILAAMKCRGFQGHYYLLDHFALTAADRWFAAAAVLCLMGLAGWEWGVSGYAPHTLLLR